MAAPSVYAAIAAITAEVAGNGIPKAHLNQIEQYQYRSIDDVLNRLAPLLAKYKLCVLPRVVERVAIDRHGSGDTLLVNVVLKVVYAIVSAEDGSSHLVEAYGEALDAGDKGTAKAMSAAYKGAMLQAFCIPVADANDADATSHRLKARTHEPAPIEGWEQWAGDIAVIVRSCESEEAIARVQQRHRAALQSLSRERADLYGEVGQVFGARRAELRAGASNGPDKKIARRRKRERETAAAREPVDA